MKDFLYTALGGAILLKEHVEEEVEKLHKQGKLSKEEGVAFLDKIKAKGKESEEDFKVQLKAALKEVITELDLATKKDIESIKQSIT